MLFLLFNIIICSNSHAVSILLASVAVNSKEATCMHVPFTFVGTALIHALSARKVGDSLS